MARMLGDAFVVVSPETKAFRSILDAEVRKAVAGVRATVPVYFDTVSGRNALGQFISRAEQQARVKFNLDMKQADTALTGLQARMKALAATLAQMRVTVDDKGAEATIARLQGRLLTLIKKTAKIELTADTSKLDAQLAAEEAQLKLLKGMARDLGGFGVTVSGGTLADVTARVAALKAEIRDLKFNVDTSGLIAAETALTGLEAATDRFRKDTKSNVGVGLFDLILYGPGGKKGGGGGGGGGFGFFGFLGRTIGFTKAWHVALSALIEAIVLFTGVMAAAVTGALVMAPAIEDITTNLKAMHTVNEALHQTIGPLTGQIHQLGAALAPRVVELYGAALGVVAGKYGLLREFGPKVVTLFDDLAAKFGIWVSAQQSGGKIIQTGIGFIIQLAHIFGSLGQAIANVIKSDPGIVHMLLNILGAAAQVLNIISRIPGPLLLVALALHGAWVWGNVLWRVLARVALSAGSAAKALAGLAVNPFFWVAAAAVALGAFAYQGTQASNSAKDFVKNLESGLGNLSASSAIFQIALDIRALNEQIAQTPAAASKLAGLAQNGFGMAAISARWQVYSASFVNDMQRWGHAIASIPQALSSWHALGGLVGSFKNAIVGMFTTSGGQAMIASNNAKLFTAEIQKLTGQQATLFAVSGKLTKRTHDLAQSFALMDLAGVRAGDSVEVATAKVDNLTRGYANLVGTGSTLNNSLNAVTFQALQQQSQISALTGAWDAFFGTVTGGISGFLTFAQAMNTMNQSIAGNAKGAAALATAQARVASAQDRLNKLLGSGGPSAVQAASATDRLRSAQDHLNVLQKTGHATALQVQSATDRVRSAQDHLNAVMSKGGPTTLAVTAATDRLRAAQLNLQVIQGKGVASFTGLNANSLTLRQNFIAAASAAQKQADALLTLSSAAGLGATGTDLVNRGIRDMIQVMLPGAKQSQELTDALFALAQQGGYKGADSFRALSKWVGNTKNPMKDLQKVTDILTHSAANLTQDVKNLSVALGRTLNDAMATAIFEASGGQKTFDDFAKAIDSAGLDSDATRKAAGKLAISLYDLTGNTKDAHKEFLTFAEKGLGLTATAAEGLWKTTLPGLQGQIDKMHGKDLAITLSTSGSGKIIIVGTGINTRTINTTTGQVRTIGGHTDAPGQAPRPGAARGWLVSGGIPGRDSVPILAMPGELIVPAHMAKMLKPILGGKIPGFAAGGFVAGPARAESAIGTAATTVGTAAVIDFATAAVKAVNTAANQFPGSGFGLGGGSPNANARLARSMYPSISPMDWAAWNYVAMRESGWNQFATNPSSGAYGIPQALPYSKMPRAAWPGWAGGSSNPAAQIAWMWDYMQAVYGGPVGAAVHESAFNWYDRGGKLKPGPNFMWNGTGRTEHLVPAGQGGSVNITLNIHGPVGSQRELQNWLVQSINNASRQGRMIYAFRNSPSGVVR